jgi:N-hydroxyarylamine O-acetyltransferase
MYGDRVDLDAYCRRIAYNGPLTPTFDVLRELHLAHLAAIPFENLDVLLGRPVKLDLGSLETKLVRSRRGGYCFEQNSLYRAVLEAIGFKLQGLAARVISPAEPNAVRPRTHMALLVEAHGEQFLADVGFGGDGLLEPLPLVDSVEFSFPIVAFRLRECSGEWTLSGARNGQWTSLYTFTLEPQHAIDYEVANFYTSCHPESHFRRSLTAQRVTPAERTILRTRELTILRERGTEKLEVKDSAQAEQILREYFALDVPEPFIVPKELYEAR